MGLPMRGKSEGDYGARHTRFSLMAGLSAPRMSFWAAVVRSDRPAMGRYSWLRLGSLRRMSSACCLDLERRKHHEDLDTVAAALPDG